MKCNIWRVAVRPSYIQDARFLKVNTHFPLPSRHCNRNLKEKLQPLGDFNSELPPNQRRWSTLLHSFRYNSMFHYHSNKSALLVDVLILQNSTPTHKHSFYSNNFNIILPFTHLNLGSKVKNEWSHTSTPPTCLYAVSRDDFTCLLTLRSPSILSFPFIKILYPYYVFCPLYTAVISVINFTLLHSFLRNMLYCIILIRLI